MSLKDIQTQGSIAGDKTSDTQEKICSILAKMDVLLDCENRGDSSRYEGPRGVFAQEYVRLYNHSFNDLDFNFSLSADDIMNKTMRQIVGYTGKTHSEDQYGVMDKKVGRGVIGCTGTAKLFCALAEKEGLNCYVVMTAKKSDWIKVRKQAENKCDIAERDIINGHQIIAIEFPDGWYAFDPGYKAEDVQYGFGYIEKRNTKFKDLGQPQIGKDLDMPRFKDHFVTAIISPQEFAKVSSYQDVANLYSSGKINDSSFTVELKANEQDSALMKNQRQLKQIRD